MRVYTWIIQIYNDFSAKEYTYIHKKVPWVGNIQRSFQAGFLFMFMIRINELSNTKQDAFEYITYEIGYDDVQNRIIFTQLSY